MCAEDRVVERQLLQHAGKHLVLPRHVGDGLQLRLALEHTTFEAIREETRKDAALHYLGTTGIALGQLADILGFSEQSAMTRSCRRWFGVPPSALRRDLSKGPRQFGF